MTISKKEIKQILDNKSLSQNNLAKLIDVDHGSFSKMIRGENPFPDYVITKLLPILEVSREEFDSWTIADKYSKEIIKLAIKAKRDICHPAPDAGSNKQTNINGKIPDRVRNDRKKKLILTTKIDAILEEKGLSRTQLSKLIKYSQSSINEMIVGKRNISKSVLERMSDALEISQNEITSWILADNYNLNTLQMASAHK